MLFSAAYQITQKCIFNCAICHRRYIRGESILHPAARRQMVALLKDHGLKRLTITGGEPILLGEEIFDFLKYLHSQQIHTCLSTTGYKLDLPKLIELNGYLDQLLLPIRSLDLEDWIYDFGKSKHCIETFENTLKILEWIKSTEIILMVSTVVHKNNIQRIIDLGWKLYSLNPNIIWSIDEYYPMGKKVKLREQFEINEIESEAIRGEIAGTFKGTFKYISFNDAGSRATSPDYLITPSADLVTTSNYGYSRPNPSVNLLTGGTEMIFKNRRPWHHYRNLCRDWGWGDFDQTEK